jgi:hypothetical protein
MDAAMATMNDDSPVWLTPTELGDDEGEEDDEGKGEGLSSNTNALSRVIFKEGPVNPKSNIKNTHYIS